MSIKCESERFRTKKRPRKYTAGTRCCEHGGVKTKTDARDNVRWQIKKKRAAARVAVCGQIKKRAAARVTVRSQIKKRAAAQVTVRSQIKKERPRGWPCAAKSKKRTAARVAVCGRKKAGGGAAVTNVRPPPDNNSL
jgi:hypothetical protein